MTIEERANKLYRFRYLKGEEREQMKAKRHAFLAGAEEQKAEDEKYIKLLEEDRNAFIAFCHNIINGMYISVIDAAKEQLGYLENKAMEEE